MTNTPSPDEDRELIEHLRDMAQGLDCGPEEENGPFHSALSEAADRLESLLADRAKLEEALRDLAEAARNACDARLHTPLIEALAEADYLALNRSTDHTP